jgi:ATP-dependent RNA helicase RhlE
MTFKDFNLNASLLNALDDLQLIHPTTIQEKSFSVIMSGVDVCGIAQTGTGKTIAYLLPMLRLHKFSKEKHPQMLVMVPTRELALQVEEVAKRLSKYMTVRIASVYGGVNITPQMLAVKDGVDLIIATPGRLLDLIYSGSLRMNSIKRLVIDEMDEMLNLGFRPQLERVLDSLPTKRQNLLFSATITDEVNHLLDDFFKQPKRIEAAPTGTPLESIHQRIIRVPNFYTKINLLKYLLKLDDFQKVLLFAASKKKADKIFELIQNDFKESIGIIHSNKDQRNRMLTIQNFQAGELRIVVATDLVARGIDVDAVSHVICFDVPDVVENYIHRIGRTGRAEQQGHAITLVSPWDEENLIAVEAFMNYQIEEQAFDDSIEISEQLIDEEMPKVYMPELNADMPKNENIGTAFHEKAIKQKVFKKPVSFKEKMALKYKKPKKRRPKQ